MKSTTSTIKEILEQEVPNGKQALMVLAEELDKINNQLIEIMKRLPPEPRINRMLKDIVSSRKKKH